MSRSTLGPITSALTLALTFTGCHEDATHADFEAAADAPRCDALVDLDPCPHGHPHLRLWRRNPADGDVLSELWTIDDPDPVVGWTLVVELCSAEETPLLERTAIETATVVIWWFGDDFTRTERWQGTDGATYFRRVYCLGDSSKAIERFTVGPDGARVERWSPQP